jgi:glycosyltransferase involved in cell wall biosynthesis
MSIAAPTPSRPRRPADDVRPLELVERPKIGVLFVNTATLPPLGADTWVHVQIMRRLDRASHVVHTACAPGSPGRPTPTYRALESVSDLHVVPVDLGPELAGRTSPIDKARGVWETLPALISLARLARYIRRHDIQIIHASDRPRDAFASNVLARLTGAKCIVHVHVGYDTWMTRLRRWSLKRADALIAISDFVKGSLVSSGHRHRTTHVVLNAIDVDDWHPGIGRNETRRELGLPETAPVLVTVCRLFAAKGLEELIQALAMIREEQPEVRLLIVGDDGPLRGTYERALASLVHELGLDDHVVFTGRRSDVARLMAAADVYAMPSVDEPFGLVFLEAMAMERPVVALDNGGTPEVVEHGRSGLLSSPGDIEGFAANVLLLLREPELREQMGRFGRRRVEERFTIDRMARDTASVYRLVAS